MAIPVEGEEYTIQPGDTLERIAARAYGDAILWPRIWKANQTRLRSGDPNLILPGEVIQIPVLAERLPPDIASANRDQDAMTIILDGLEIRPTTGSIIRTIDTVANAYQATFPWRLGVNPALDKKIAPYSYTSVKALIGNDVIVTGLNYGTEIEISQGVTAKISGYTATADLVDSALKPPFEFNNITLEDIIKGIIEPLGFGVVFEVETGGKFDRVTARQGDTIFQFLSKLAKQREALLSCDTFGNIAITRADTESAPVAAFEENVTPGVSGWGGKFDGRKRFNVYRAVGRSPLGEKEATVTDNLVPRARFTTIQADDETEGEIESAARWARNKTLSDTLAFVLTVADFRNVGGELWRENTKVTVISPSMFLPNGFDFLINRVKYVQGERGRRTELSLVPPTVYTQGEIEEPWQL
ncbi:MAG: LysM peptidoglycan-binding domain-containing protein [Nitrospinaceae bacterium]